MEILLPFLSAFLLALIHIFGHRLKFLHGIPRSKWLSFAGGGAVAYVFVHLMPEMEEWQEVLTEEQETIASFFPSHLYLVSLIGLIIYYGVEKLAMHRHSPEVNPDLRSEQLYKVHIWSFALYNFLIGYLLFHREEEGFYSFFLYTLAMAFHFIVNDYGLFDHHEKRYVHSGRWIMAGAILLGTLVGWVIDIHRAGVAVLFAVIAGGIILNVLKEELPKERESNLWAFIFGAAAFSTIVFLHHLA